MKNFIFLILIILCSSQLKAQTLYIPNGSSGIDASPSGNVNIGIGVIDPQEKLDIEGSIRVRNGSNSWRFVTNSSGSFSIKQTGYNGAVNIYNNGTVNTNSLNIYNGNVGIGYTVPSHKLHVHGQDVAFYSLTADNNFHMGRGDTQKVQMMVNDNHLYFDLVQDADGNSGHVMFFRNLAEGTSENNDIRFQTTGENRLAIKAGGNVGIGTTTPSEKLHIEENTNGENISFRLRAQTNSGAGRSWHVTGDPDARKLHIGEETGSTDLVIDQNGQIGIGTANPNAKLTVAGNIESQEVKVTVDAGQGPDYVFEEDYNLRSLEETEEFIKANKHLPEVPSAKVMESEGLNLKEMNLKLLQKIEELTLHMIEQNKEIESLKTEMQNLKPK